MLSFTPASDDDDLSVRILAEYFVESNEAFFNVNGAWRNQDPGSRRRPFSPDDFYGANPILGQENFISSGAPISSGFEWVHRLPQSEV